MRSVVLLWIPKVPGQILNSGRPGVSWGTAGVAVCHPSTQAAVHCPPAVLELVFGSWNLFSWSCFSSFLCVYFSLSRSTMLSGIKNIQIPLFWSLIAKLSGVRTAFEIIRILTGLKFQVLVDWVCMPWVITKAEKKKMMCNHLHTQCWTSFSNPVWVYPQLRKKASHISSVYLAWKSWRQNLSLSMSFKVVYQKKAHSFIHVSKEIMLCNSFSFPLV